MALGVIFAHDVMVAETERRHKLLILARKVEQSIILRPGTGEKIEVKIIGVRGDRVQLGITAPRRVSVDRMEIDEIKYGMDNE